MIDLGKAAVDRILGFLGYGNPRASLWFIGLEEGLGEMNDSDIVANLSARGRFSEVMDLSDAHLSLLEGGRPYDLSQRQKFTQVWLWMGRLARAIEGALDWRDVNRAKDYIRNRLGRSAGRTFLTYLSPIPAKNLSDRSWVEFLKHDEPDLNPALAARQQKLRNFLDLHQPRLVICHGSSARRRYHSLLNSRGWELLPSHSSIEICDVSPGRCYVVSPFFGNGQMSISIAGELVTGLRDRGVLAGRSDDIFPRASGAEIESTSSLRTSVSVEHSGSQPSKRGLDVSQSGGRSPIGPQWGLELLHTLEQLGFNDDSFWRLHHFRLRGKRETISGFRTYCRKISEFSPTGTNERVCERLSFVLQAYRDRGLPPNQTGIFVELAVEAFSKLPPHNTGH